MPLAYISHMRINKVFKNLAELNFRGLRPSAKNAKIMRLETLPLNGIRNQLQICHDGKSLKDEGTIIKVQGTAKSDWKFKMAISFQ